MTMNRTERILAKLRKFELTQRALAVQAEVDESLLSRYLKGKAKALPETWRRIEEALEKLCTVAPEPLSQRIQVPRPLPGQVRCVLIEYTNGDIGMHGDSEWGQKALRLAGKRGRAGRKNQNRV
jgi:transcriptional regulator with XRE-family HTH domain